jgi:hypothetical protein
MLRRMPSLDTLRHEVRRRVCVHCYRRPWHSESLGPEVIRPCEPTCPVFVHLPMLRKTAMTLDPMLSCRQAAVRHRIDYICNASTQQTEDRQAVPQREDNSPLRRYRNEIVKAVLDLVGEM